MVDEPLQLMLPTSASWVRRSVLLMIEDRRNGVESTKIDAPSLKQRAHMAHRPGDFGPVPMTRTAVPVISDITTDGLDRRRDWRQYLAGRVGV